MKARDRLNHFLTEPYPFYRELREMNRYELIDGVMPHIKTSHMVTRYDEVAMLIKDSRIGSDPSIAGGIDIKDSWWVPKGFRSWMNTMVFKDGQEHARLRKLVNKAFKPSMILAWREGIEELADELLDDMARKEGPVDFYTDFGGPLPLRVIADIMGVTEEYAHDFSEQSNKFFQKMPNTYWDLFMKVPQLSKFQRVLEALVESKRVNPGDDLTSALIAVEEDGDRLDSLELTGMMLNLLSAGHETTINLLSSGLLALLENPDQLHRFKNDPGLLDSMIEELLRFANPVQSVWRFAKEDIEINGKVIKKGDNVMLVIGSANRDEMAFENADQMDIGRSPNHHLSFGAGNHFCLGAQLARLEAGIAFTRLFERFPNIRLAIPPSELKWRKSRILRGLAELPVILE